MLELGSMPVVTTMAVVAASRGRGDETEASQADEGLHGLAGGGFFALRAF